MVKRFHIMIVGGLLAAISEGTVLMLPALKSAFPNRLDSPERSSTDADIV